MRGKYFFVIIFFVFTNSAALFVYADSMASSNYIILDDATNCGGDLSSSTNYKLSDSFCENASGAQASALYALDSGFQAGADEPFIDITLSGNTLNFSGLSPSSVATSTITLTVSTNASDGYSADIYTDGAFRTSAGDTFTDASASDTISAGSGKFGITTSGDDGQYNSTDTGIGITAKTFAARTSGASGSATVVTFKAAPATTTNAGQYNQAITITAAGTF